MSRTTPAGFVTALNAGTIEPYFLVNLEFDSPNAIFVWTGIGNKTYDGETYYGLGDSMTIDTVEETSDLSVKGVKLTFNGLNSTTDVVGKALAEPYQNRTLKIFLGIEGQSDVVEIFAGRMDKMVIEDSPEVATISITAEHKLVDLERPAVRRYTEESHKSISSDNANDTFLSFIADFQDKKVVFGGKDL